MEKSDENVSFFKFKGKYYKCCKIFKHDHRKAEEQPFENIKVYSVYDDLFVIYKNATIELEGIGHQFQGENHGETKRKISTAEGLVNFIYSNQPEIIKSFKDCYGNFLEEIFAEESGILIYPEKYVPANFPVLNLNDFFHRYPSWRKNDYFDFQKVNPVLFIFMKETGRLDPNRDYSKIHNFLKSYWGKDLPRLWQNK